MKEKRSITAQESQIITSAPNNQPNLNATIPRYQKILKISCFSLDGDPALHTKPMAIRVSTNVEIEAGSREKQK